MLGGVDKGNCHCRTLTAHEGCWDCENSGSGEGEESECFGEHFDCLIGLITTCIVEDGRDFGCS